MSVDRGIRPQSLRVLLAHLHFGSHSGLNAPEIVDRNLSEHAIPDEQRPAPPIEHFTWLIAVDRPFEVAIDPGSERNLLSRGEFLGEKGSFSNVGSQSAIERFGL